MRIRKAVDRWSWKAFALIFGIMALIYNGFFVLAGYAEGGFQAGDEVRFWALNGLLMPLILAGAITSTVRKASLFINDYNDLPDFHTRLIHQIKAAGFSIDQQSASHIRFKPTSWFFKLMKSWFGTENLDLHFGEEIVVIGSLKKISDLQDVLTWHPDFKK